MEVCNDLSDIIEVIQQDVESKALHNSFSWPNSMTDYTSLSDYGGGRDGQSTSSANYGYSEDFKQFESFQDSVTFRDSSESRSPEDYKIFQDSKEFQDLKNSRTSKDSGNFEDLKLFLNFEDLKDPEELQKPEPINSLSYESDQDAFYDEDYESDSSSDEDSKKEIVASTSEVVAPKTCLICGDPTSCCHYDVPACSGCKTFFRRTVLSQKEYKKCKNNGKCDILRGARCRSCRFDRCIIVGMNPAAIQLPKDTDLDTVLTMVNQRKRKILEEKETTSLAIVPKRSPIFEQTLTQRDIEFLLFLEAKAFKLRESNYNPRPFYTESIPNILEKKTALRFSDKYEKPKHWPIPWNEEKWKKHHDECHKKKEWKPPKRNWFAIDLILTIEMSKAIPVFERLQFSDKEAAMRHTLLMSTLLTQSYYSIVQHHDTLTMPDGHMPIRLPHGHPTNLHYEVFCRVLEPIKRISLTQEEYVLLKTIMLCNPAAKGISEKGRKLLEKEFERYSKILLRHMQEKLGMAPGAVRYSQIMQIFEAMAHFAQKHRELHVWIQIKVGKIFKNEKNHIRILDEALS